MNFVLVALGKIPEYLDDCIFQIKKTQKKSKIFLLINKNLEYKNKNCKIIFVENLKKSKEHNLFVKKSRLNGNVPIEVTKLEADNNIFISFSNVEDI